MDLATRPPFPVDDALQTIVDASTTDDAVLDRIRIVLVAPSHPGNVGATARAMKVMGLSRLALVAPRYDDVLTQADALAFASGAVDVLENARVHATLDDALAGTTHAIAMSAREREFAPPLTTLRAAAVAAIDSARRSSKRSIAFVFGSERYGLSNEDVLRCQARCRIETSDAYGSLNLAQAVQLVAYECRIAALAVKSPREHDDVAAPASHEEREALIDHFEQGLLAIGYLDPDAPKKLMPRLRRLFARARLEHEEVQWLRGMAKAMLRAKGPGR
jgi:tRNA/rRNA methyltransferase